MSGKQRRHWFRFGLRSLFLTITLLACWLGWESSVVRERRALLKELQSNPAYQVTLVSDPTVDVFSSRVVAELSPIRRWLGDERVAIIWYNWYQTPTQAELDRVAKVFPEAELLEMPAPPCHPGCFPRATQVATPSGPRPIEFIRPGDLVNTIERSGELHATAVKEVFVTDNRLWQIETQNGILLTTETQPLCLAADRTEQAGKLQPGDVILRYRDGVVCQEKVLAVSHTGRTEKVFNLILGDSQIFLANQFLARSKPPAEAGSQ